MASGSSAATARHFIDRSRARLRGLATANGGNVTIIFALAIIPILGFVGAAIDYSNASAVRAKMQAAADATVLMLSKDAAKLTSSQLQSKANDYFKALFTRPDISDLTIVATYTSSGGSKVVLNASSGVKTHFMGLMGFPSIKVAANSEAKWGSARLRVALVLDTTGSMANDGKIEALKSATKDLLDQLQATATANGDVYVSIVPFSKNVNVGPGNASATWIDWTDWESEPEVLKGTKPSGWDQIGPGDSCPFTTYSHGFRCAPTPTGTSTVSSIPSSGSYAGYICPSTDTGQKDSTKIGIMYNGCYDSVEKTKTVSTGWSASCSGLPNCSCSGYGGSRICKQNYFEHTWIKNARSTWNGCVTDRGAASGPSQDYDRKVIAPSAGVPASLFPAEQNSYCSAAVTGLNYNWSAMKSTVNGFYPSGATNQPIGLVWGWQSLAGGGPFTVPPKDSGYQYQEAIVLMSDGLNTLDRWYGNGSSTSTAVDKRMHESSTVGTCANIKAAGITIYALQVNTEGDPKSTLLANCASGPDKFWMVTSASGIGTVFNAIGTNLTKLRLAK
jgi:Flp pilus assembly protein TadG